MCYEIGIVHPLHCKLVTNKLLSQYICTSIVGVCNLFIIVFFVSLFVPLVLFHLEVTKKSRYVDQGRHVRHTHIIVEADCGRNVTAGTVWIIIAEELCVSYLCGSCMMRRIAQVVRFNVRSAVETFRISCSDII